MAERIIAPDWLILRQAMSDHVPRRSDRIQKYAHGRKSAMIVLSGHFKTLRKYCTGLEVNDAPPRGI